MILPSASRTVSPTTSRSSVRRPPALAAWAVRSDTTYVVSLLTAQAAKAGGRLTDDLLVVGETVRDADGKIIGCLGLGRI